MDFLKTNKKASGRNKDLADLDNLPWSSMSFSKQRSRPFGRGPLVDSPSSFVYFGASWNRL